MAGKPNPGEEGLEAMTLASVIDGALEEGFQERVQQAKDILADYDRLAQSAGGYHVVTIPLEVQIFRSVKDGTFSVGARALAIKPPKPLALFRPIFEREDGFKVKPEGKQEPLPFTPPRVVNGEEG